MTASPSEADPRTPGEAFQTNRWMPMGLGLLLIGLGGLAVAHPNVSTIDFEIYVVWLFLIGGLASLVALFSTSSVAAFLWTLLSSTVSLMAGAYLIWTPEAGPASLMVVLATLFAVEGVLQILASIAWRGAFPGSWGWMLLSGLLDLLLAALIIAGWPQTASWALGLLVGVNLITSGVAIFMPAATASRPAATGNEPGAGR